MKILCYKRVQSTNSIARRLAEQAAPEWTIVISRSQTMGRGRNGHNWKSPTGGLWLSIILRPRLSPINSWILQFLVANSVCSTIERLTGIQTGLKWPNDIVCARRKLGGILIETKIERDVLLYAVIGIGINANLNAKQLPEGAVTIRDLLGKNIGLRSLTEGLVTDLQARYSRGFDSRSITSEWWTRCIHRGQRVIVNREENTVEGTSTGIDDHGHLLLQTTGAGPVRVVDGQLTMR